MSHLVVVSVGTDHHPFDRLVNWMSDWAEANPSVEVIIQYGTARAPRDVVSHELIPHDQLRTLFSEAVAVVSHGGPSTVMDARMAGRLPIVAPRDPSLGEHVDDHQMRFANHLAEHGLARLTTTREQLFTALADALADPGAFKVPLLEQEAPQGVVQFGALVNELLQVPTSPIELSSLTAQ